MKIELSKDEIGTIRWAVSALIEDIESDFLNEVADKEFNDLKNNADFYNCVFGLAVR